MSKNLIFKKNPLKRKIYMIFSVPIAILMSVREAK